MILRTLALSVMVAGAGANLAQAGQPDTQTAVQTAAQTALPPTTPTALVARIAETVPVPVDVPEPTAKALQHHRSGIVLWVVEQVWSLATLFVILGTGFSARLRNWSKRIGRNWFFTVAPSTGCCSRCLVRCSNR